MPEANGERIQVTGLRKTEKQLKELDLEAHAELRALEREMIVPVAEKAREGAPEQSGRLRRSIKVVVNAKGAFVKAGGKLVPYAGAIHFGWHKRGIKPNKFVYRAFDEERPVIEATFVRRMDALVKRTVHGNGTD